MSDSIIKDCQILINQVIRKRNKVDDNELWRSIVRTMSSLSTKYNGKNDQVLLSLVNLIESLYKTDDWKSE